MGRARTASNTGMNLTRPEHIGASQLIRSVRRLTEQARQADLRTSGSAARRNPDSRESIGPTSGAILTLSWRLAGTRKAVVMSSALEFVGMALPACVTFGPLFLAIDGRSVKYTRLLRYLGAVMVATALFTGWLASSRQANRISLLEQRIESLATLSAPSP